MATDRGPAQSNPVILASTPTTNILVCNHITQYIMSGTFQLRVLLDIKLIFRYNISSKQNTNQANIKLSVRKVYNNMNECISMLQFTIAFLFLLVDN